MTILTYAPSEVVLLIAGFQVIDLVSVKLNWNTERFSVVKGIRGKNTRVRNKDTGAVIEIDVLQTSITNDVFSQIVTLDEKSQVGNLSVSLKDNSGSTVVVSSNAFLASYPNFELKDVLQPRTWKLVLLSTDQAIVGGNLKPAGNLF